MDKLQVINHALMKCGLPLAAVLGDCDWNALTAFQTVEEKLLRGFSWNFAQRLCQLEEVEERVVGYRHVYRLPGDYVRRVDCRTSWDIRAPVLQGKVMGRFFFCQGSPCVMRYVAKVPVEQWPADFGLAMASGIACEIASLSAEKAQLVATLMQWHMAELASAQANDASENSERIPLDHTYLNVREQAARE